MAGAAEGLTAARAALLLRCQVAREGRQRAAAARAAWGHATAADALAAAAAGLAAFEAGRLDGMRRAYDALDGQRVAGATLRALPVIETAQRAEAARLAAAAAAAKDREREAAAAEAAALAALAAAARTTRRRERLADATSKRHQAVLGLAEEAEREDAAADDRRPAP